MRSLNPACKFIALLVPTFFLAARPHPAINLAVFALCLLGLFLARVKWTLLAGLFAPILLAAAGMFVTGWRFSADSGLPVNAATLHVGSSALWNALLLSSRVLAYAGLGLLFALTTDRIRLVASFRRQFHLPQSFAYGLLAAWGIFPQMMLEYRRARCAFRARGQRVAPFSPALLRPLLVKSVRWSDALALAMESKGFSGTAKRTEAAPELVHPRDIAFCLVCCAAVPLSWLVLF